MRKKNGFVNIANICTASRVLVIPLLIHALNLSRYSICFLLMVFIGITDMFDGWIARKTNTAGRVGAVLDIGADCVVVFSIQFFLAYKQLWPLYPIIFGSCAILSYCIAGNKRKIIRFAHVGKYIGAAYMISLTLFFLFGTISVDLSIFISNIAGPILAIYAGIVTLINLAEYSAEERS